MTMPEARSRVAPGEAAPEFTLPAVDRNENVSLADYRGRSPVFLALMVGLWCPFCRRQIAQIGTIEGKLKALGIESLVVVATPPENARLYFKFRPTRVRLASDPELSTHRAYGIPRPAVNPDLIEALATASFAGPTSSAPAKVSPESGNGPRTNQSSARHGRCRAASRSRRFWPAPALTSRLRSAGV